MRNPQVNKLLFMGCGEIAQKCAVLALADGAEVIGIARRARETPPGLQFWQGDAGAEDMLARMQKAAPQVIVLSLSPDGHDAEAYEATYLRCVNALCDRWPQRWGTRVIFISSTSVYHQQDGSWVNEDSATQPSSPTAKVLLRCEQRVLSHFSSACVLRFSGIYGPGRDYLLRQVCANQGGSDDYSNRIHVDDCAAIVWFLARLEEARLPKIVLASDKTPVPGREIRHWLAEQLGRDPQQLVAGTASARGGNKRCDSSLLSSLGYQFRYADFRQGYRQAITEFKLSEGK